jgi:hypothetical protein
MTPLCAATAHSVCSVYPNILQHFGSFSYILTDTPATTIDQQCGEQASNQPQTGSSYGKGVKSLSDGKLYNKVEGRQSSVKKCSQPKGRQFQESWIKRYPWLQFYNSQLTKADGKAQECRHTGGFVLCQICKKCGDKKIV